MWFSYSYKGDTTIDIISQTYQNNQHNGLILTILKIQLGQNVDQ